MKHLYAFLVAALSIVVATACSGGDSEVRFSSNDCQACEVLFGDTLRLPVDDACVPGALAVAGSGYMVYLYYADNFLLYVDSAFTSVRRLAPRGEGPGEVSGVSGTFGQQLGDSGLLSVYDPNVCRLYGWNANGDSVLREYATLTKPMARYAPMNVIRLQSGCLIAPRGDFQYGMVCYNPSDSTVSEWPLGIKCDDMGHHDYSHTSMRDVSYCSDRGLIAEIYGCHPTVVLHDESGNVFKLMTFSDYKPSDSQSDAPECFKTVCLTNDHVWLLLDGRSTGGENDYVLALDYDGNLVARLSVLPAQTMAVDERRSLILTVNPENDDAAIMRYRYQLPFLNNQSS